MGADVSKNTVAILLVIVILLSIAGTWVALNMTQSAQTGIGSNTASGEVRVFVEPKPVTVDATSKILVDVIQE